MPLALAVLALLIWSGANPYDRATWWMEVAPVLVVAPILALTYRSFPLTSLLYILIAMHAIILITGGAYTYARVPIGFTVRDWLELSRNPYDKLGHFAQGFVPALVAREIFIRRAIIRGRGWIATLTVCVALAISALYELVEWLAAIALGQGAEAFLGTQGDVWDTQSDMAMALLGAVAALAVLGRWHQRQVDRLAITDQRAST